MALSRLVKVMGWDFTLYNAIISYPKYFTSYISDYLLLTYTLHLHYLVISN